MYVNVCILYCTIVLRYIAGAEAVPLFEKSGLEKAILRDVGCIIRLIF